MTDTRSERRARRHLSDESTPSDSAPPSPPSRAGGVGWLPIDDKARTGVLIEVRSAEGEETVATWHKTRHFDLATLTWKPTAYWRHSRTGVPLWFDPIEYRSI
jgi:hypothetical protein